MHKSITQNWNECLFSFTCILYHYSTHIINPNHWKSYMWSLNHHLLGNGKPPNPTPLLILKQIPITHNPFTHKPYSHNTHNSSTAPCVFPEPLSHHRGPRRWYHCPQSCSNDAPLSPPCAVDSPRPQRRQERILILSVQRTCRLIQKEDCAESLVPTPNAATDLLTPPFPQYLIAYPVFLSIISESSHSIPSSISYSILLCIQNHWRVVNAWRRNHHISWSLFLMIYRFIHRTVLWFLDTRNINLLICSFLSHHFHIPHCATIWQGRIL